MFIPAEGEGLFCLARVVALYREGNATKVLHADSTLGVSSLTPQTLKKRGESLWKRSAVSLKARAPISITTEELLTDGREAE